MRDGTPACYAFGAFRLDPADKSVRRDGGLIALTPKVFDTLHALVEHAGRLVTKDELMRRVWPDTFVEEATLAQSVSVLRKALGDSPDHRYIETVPKRGYRFIAAVARVQAEIPVVAAPSVDRPAPLGLRRAAWTWAGASAVLLAAVLVAWSFLGREPAGIPADAAGPRVMLAVLPFANLGADSGDEYMSDGLTEELITQLGGMQPDRLGVIARTSAMRYKASPLGIAEIGQALGVTHMIQGSVRREGRRVRVAVQLIQVRDETHVWSDTYEQDAGQVLAMQLRVAHDTAQQVQASLSLPPSALPTVRTTLNPQAYDLYLKAHYFWNKRIASEAAKAMELYQQAVALDPRFTQAWAEMSRCYLSLSRADISARETYEQAVAAARHAIALDDTSADAHYALGTAALHLFDWSTAAQAFGRAESLNPRLRSVDLMLLSGQIDAALDESRRAIVTDPVNFLTHHVMGATLFYARRYDEAIGFFRQALDLDPRHVWSIVRMGVAYAQLGRYEEAIDALKDTGRPGRGALAYALALSGRREEALDVLGAMTAAADGAAEELAFDVAVVHVALGDFDSAFHWLDLAARARPYHMIYLTVDPRLDPLHADPRFTALVRRIGLPS